MSVVEPPPCHQLFPHARWKGNHWRTNESSISRSAVFLTFLLARTRQPDLKLTPTVAAEMVGGGVPTGWSSTIAGTSRGVNGG